MILLKQAIKIELIPFSALLDRSTLYRITGLDDLATILFNAYQDIQKVYDRQANNYSVMLITFDDDSHISQIVGRDYSL